MDGYAVPPPTSWRRTAIARALRCLRPVLAQGRFGATRSAPDRDQDHDGRDGAAGCRTPSSASRTPSKPGDSVDVLRGVEADETSAIRRGRALRRGSCSVRDVSCGRRTSACSLGRCFHGALARRPRVAILSTGDELVDLGVAPGPGQIVQQQRLLAGRCRRGDGRGTRRSRHRRDRPDIRQVGRSWRRSAPTSSSRRRASRSAAFDYVRRILLELGYRERFWKVAQTRYKAAHFGTCGRDARLRPAGQPRVLSRCFYVYVLRRLRR